MSLKLLVTRYFSDNQINKWMPADITAPLGRGNNFMRVHQSWTPGFKTPASHFCTKQADFPNSWINILVLFSPHRTQISMYSESAVDFKMLIRCVFNLRSTVEIRQGFVCVCFCVQRNRQRQGDLSQQNSKTTVRLADGYAKAAWLAMRANPFPPEQAVTGQDPRRSRTGGKQRREGRKERSDRERERRIRRIWGGHRRGDSADRGERQEGGGETWTEEEAGENCKGRLSRVSQLFI